MKKHVNRKTMLLASVTLLLLVTVGASLAYIFTRTEPVENTFKPSKVTCAVVENGSPNENTDGIVNITDIKTNVQIKNTGDTDAYIRAAVVVNWMSADGTKVWATKPVEGVDYEIDYNLTDTGWFDGKDGFYYYKSPVAPGTLTPEVLITSANLKPGIVGPKGTDGTGYYLSVEIVASAIQAEPDTVVAGEWGVTVSNETIGK